MLRYRASDCRHFLQGYTIVVLLIITSGATLATEGEEVWPLRLEPIWETPEKGEPVFAEGFPPPEIKAVLADTSIPDEDKEWVVNRIRLWAAYRTKRLWLDDGSAGDIPVVQPGDEVQVFTIYKSRNLKYWLARAMRFEGPDIPPKPPNPTSREEAQDPEYWEEMNAWHAAQCAQKAYWREVLMDVDGRIYWEKELGPYDTQLEGGWIGDVAAYISDDGENVVLRGGSQYLIFCDKDGTRTPAMDTGGMWSDAILSADGSTIALLRENRSSGTSDGQRSRQSCVGLYDRRGNELWRSNWVNGSAEYPVVLAMAEGVDAVMFSILPYIPATAPDRMTYLLGSEGAIIGTYSVHGEICRGSAFSDDSSLVTMVFDHSVQAIETASGKELWRYEMEIGWPGSLRGISCAGDVVVVSGCGDSRCTPLKGELLILSTEGTLLFRGQHVKAQASPSPSGILLVEMAGGLKISQLVVEE